MAQDPKILISGLYTNASDLAGGPPGGLTQCKNIDLSKANIAQCRRGFDLLNSFPNPSDRADKIIDYKDVLYAHFDSKINTYDSGTWTSRGALTAPVNALVPRSVFSNNNLYFLSNNGMLKIDSATSSLIVSGLPSGVSTLLTESTSTGTAVSTAKTVNYRWIIVKKDANNNLIQGPVNSNVSYTNGSGATKDVSVLGFLPSGLLGTETIQVYRSAGLAAVSDELKLIYEFPLSSSNVANVSKSVTSANTGTDVLTSNGHGMQDGTVVQVVLGTLVGPTAATNYIIASASTNTFKMKTLAGVFVDITASGTATITTQVAFGIIDLVPDGLLGTSLYTSPSQNGISQSNTQAPLATDITVYKDFIFFSDTKSKQIFNFSILSVDSSSTNGITTGTTITIGSEIYTAGGAASYGSGSGTFAILSSGSQPSVAIRVDSAARSLVDVINRSSLAYRATLVFTDSSSLPGKIMLEAKLLSDSQYAVSSSVPSAFSPQLPLVANSTSVSSSDTFRNGLMFSRQGLPEAVPAANVFRVGSANDPILRIIGLRDALLIFKRRDGCFVLRGENSSSFSVTLLDSTARLVSGESIVVVNGLVYGLFEGGICSVSDTSVQVISEAIKDKIQTVYGIAFDQVKQYSFGISYEADNKYILAIPQTVAATSSTYQLVYDAANGTFSEWDLDISAGYVSSINQKLYVASATTPYIKQERKQFDETDFSDYAGQKTIVSYVDNLLTILSGIDSFAIGDLVSQGLDFPDAYITDVDLINSTISVDFVRTWITGTNDLDHYQGIQCILELAPIFSGNPAGLKHFQEISLLFKQGLIRDALIEFNSDVNSSVQSVPVTGDSASSAWGVGSWGIMPWGGISIPQPIRIGVPRQVSRCNELTIKMTHKVAQSNWQLQGIVPVFWPLSTRTAR